MPKRARGSGRREVVFQRAIDLAKSGRYENHEAITRIMARDPDFPLIADWMADPVTKESFDQFCAEGRRKQLAGKLRQP